MKPLAIARANILRMLRDRSNIFFVFIFPLALVLLIGAQFGGDFEPSLGLHDQDGGDVANAMEASLDETLEIRNYDTEEELVLAVERGSVAAGLAIPAGVEDRIRAGETVELGFLATSDGAGPQIQAVVIEAAATASERLAVGRFVESAGVASFDDGVAQAATVAGMIPPVEVTTRTTGESLFPASLGRFDIGASSQLLLFMFLTGLAGSAVLIQTRQLGMSTRMLSTPTPIWQIVTGEALGRFGVVIVQGAYIMIATLLLFRVNWGDPLGAIAILIAFAAVSAAAAVLVGSVLSNDAQAAGIGVIGGIGLAALGGSMLPLEFFSPTMTRIARFTPHAWANEAFAALVRRDGTVVDILPQLGVLAAMAFGLMIIAAWRLKAVITRR